MRFRRRRKPRVQWLPNTGTDLNATPALLVRENSSAIITNQIITFNLASPTTVIEVPMILDQAPAAGSSGVGMAAYQLRALDDETTLSYRLRRIYGSFYIVASANTGNAGDCPAAIAAEVGIIVRRTSPELGTALAPGVADTDPGNLDDNEDPWLWRKNFLLGPIQDITIAGTSTLLPAPDAGDDWRFAANALPRSNLFHTGPHQNPTVDVRSNRRVSSEERLFLDVGLTRLPSAVPPQQSQTVAIDIYFPYRALGTLSVAGTNRRNASR